MDAEDIRGTVPRGGAKFNAWAPRGRSLRCACLPWLGDHFFPTGTVLPRSFEPGDFGPEFVSRPDVVPELGRWYAYEIMLRLNTPGMRDGRVTIWLDGEVLGDFPNLRLRDVADLRIDRFNLSFHAGANPVRATRKWYDNVVAARSYIGPMRTP